MIRANPTGRAFVALPSSQQAVSTKGFNRGEGFTPGPWAIEHGVEESEGEIYVCHADTVCDVTAVCTIRDENEANARLIAAGPELYEALKDAISIIESAERETNWCSGDPYSDDGPIKEFKALLAKARGE